MKILAPAYQAEDGNIFKDKETCIFYEQKIRLTKLLKKFDIIDKYGFISEIDLIEFIIKNIREVAITIDLNIFD